MEILGILIVLGLFYFLFKIYFNIIALPFRVFKGLFDLFQKEEEVEFDFDMDGYLRSGKIKRKIKKSEKYFQKFKKIFHKEIKEYNKKK